MHSVVSTLTVCVALQYATTQTALMITPLTRLIDPDSDTMLGLQVMMFVLSFGLSFMLVSNSAGKRSTSDISIS